VIQTLTLADLTAFGAHQKGHFQLSSGLHSADYLQCALYLANPKRATHVGQLLAQRVKTTLTNPNIVVAPALGAMILGHETARAFGTPFVFTERADGRMKLRRGFTITPNQGVLVVEDVVTTGRSTKEVIEIVKSLGGFLLGVAAMVNRSGLENPFDPVPFHSLLQVDFTVWKQSECPLCRDRKPITKPGSRPVK
jgi:orotate phosphoribosyltransferase